MALAGDFILKRRNNAIVIAIVALTAITIGCREFTPPNDIIVEIEPILSQWPTVMSIAEIANVAVVLKGPDGLPISGMSVDWTTQGTILTVSQILVPETASENAVLTASLAAHEPGSTLVGVSFEQPGFAPTTFSKLVVVEAGNWPNLLAVTDSMVVGLQLTNNLLDGSEAGVVDVDWQPIDPSILKVSTPTGLDRYEALVTAHQRGLGGVTITTTGPAPRLITERFTIRISVDALMISEEPDFAWPDSMTTGETVTVGVAIANDPRGNLGVEWQTGNAATVEVVPLPDNRAQITAVASGSVELIARIEKAGFEPTEYRSSVRVLQGWRLVEVGGNHSCAISFERKTFCWGAAYSGQLGFGGVEPTSVPVPVATLLTFDRLGLGGAHSCGIIRRGARLYCWGQGAFGQLGDERPEDFSDYSDVEVPNLPVDVQRVRSVSGGYSFTVAVDTSETLWGWGENFSFQLGQDTDGFFSSKPLGVPAFFSDDSAGVADAGLAHACVLMLSGRLACWGDNSAFQLGADTACTHNVGGQFGFGCAPIRLGDNWRFKQISAGAYHTCAVTTTEDLYCWGANSHGQLGAPASATCLLVVEVPCSSQPVFVGSGFQVVSAGSTFTCALSDGVPHCWGMIVESANFELPGPFNPSLWSNPSPTVVGTNNKFETLSAGYGHFCGITSNPAGAIWCWGRQASGELGDGSLVRTDSTFVTFQDLPRRIAEPESRN